MQVATNAEPVLARPSVTAVLAFAEVDAVDVLVLNACVAIRAGGVFGEISKLCVAWDLRSCRGGAGGEPVGTCCAGLRVQTRMTEDGSRRLATTRVGAEVGVLHG